MKVLKLLVFFMAVLLVTGLGLLGYGMYAKTRAPSERVQGAFVAGAPLSAPSATHAGPHAGPHAGQGFGDVAVALPTGARVEQMLVAGDRVVLRVSGGGPDRLLVLDPLSGQVWGSFVLGAEAAASPMAPPMAPPVPPSR